MLPHKLNAVNLPVNDVDATTFQRKLRLSNLQRARTQKLMCSSCSTLVCDETRQIIPGFDGFPMTHCSTCSKIFCRTAACPVAMQDCCNCARRTSCSNCNDVEECSLCHVHVCSDCEYIKQCNYCSRNFCIDCEDDGLTLKSCDKCGRTSCGDCRDQRNISVEFCRGERFCLREFCSDCDGGSRCHACGSSPICDSCVNSTSGALSCSCCAGQSICRFCTVARTCDGCSALFCRNSNELMWCCNLECKGKLCRSCRADSPFVECDSCGVEYCSRECWQKCVNNSCQVCREHCTERPPKKKAKTK